MVVEEDLETNQEHIGALVIASSLAQLRTMKTLLATLFGCCAWTASAQTVADSLLIDGSYRTYRVHTPPGFNTAEHLPLVFNLHGLTSTGEQQELYSEMNAVADVERFVVVYPDGVNNSWNLGLGAVDEYSFFTGMMDLLEITHNIDPDRIYSCGMSQGGFMSFVLACSIYDRIAAIATVAGSMAPGLNLVCSPTRPVPVMMIHGTADGIVPYTGGIQNMAVEDAIDFWSQHDNCVGLPVTTPFPDIVLQDFCTATRIDHPLCAASSMVSLIRVDGGGHTWPGASIPIGVTNQDFEASQTIWDFFDQYDINGALSAVEVRARGEDFILLPTVFNDQPAFTNRSNELAEVRVVDAVGKMVLIFTVAPTSTREVNTSNWCDGKYLWFVTTGSKQRVVLSLHSVSAN